jgi:hypothetical protein
MLQDALMLDELGHQYGMAELHKAAEEIWDRAFDVIEHTHGAAERERAAYQGGYRTPVPLEVSRKLLGDNAELPAKFIHRSDHRRVSAPRHVLDRQDHERPHDEGPDRQP